MNKIIERLLLVFILLQPFLDVVAITNYNIINVFIRGLFLFFIVIYLLFSKKNIKLLIFTLITCLVLLIINLYLDRGLVSSISSMMKLYYIPFSILFFINIKNNMDNKVFFYVLSVYILLFLSSYIFGFGNNNYTIEDKKSGFRGVFNSINEVSAIIIGLLPIVLNYLKENKKYIISVLLIISTLLVALLTGTKVLMIGLFIIIIYMYIGNAIKIFKDMSILWKIISIISIIIILIIGIYLITYTNFYKNMVIQQRFFKSYNIFSIDFVNKVLFNNRLTFLKENFLFYKKQNIIDIIFGIGYNNQSIKLVEIDLFDILFRFGIFGLISFIIPIIFAIKKININKVAVFSIILLLLISLTSGHVLLSPNVAIYFGYIIFLQKK